MWVDVLQQKQCLYAHNALMSSVIVVTAETKAPFSDTLSWKLLSISCNAQRLSVLQHHVQTAVAIWDLFSGLQAGSLTVFCIKHLSLCV